MARYHLTPDGPKTCSAKYRCQYKDSETGAEPKHYENKASAQKAYETVMESGGDAMKSTSAKNNPSSLAEKLQTQDPVDIDKTLAELYGKHAAIAGQINQLNNDVINYGQRFNPEGDSPNDRHFKRKYDEAVVSAERLTPDLLVKLEESQKNMDPYEKEFERRGGWTRAFLVNNVGGHVHKDMNCGTCFATTEYSWMTDYSNKDESEIVSAAGERACTVCYPTAPVADLNKPTQMFTPDEIERQVARENREKVAQAKRDKTAATSVTAPDGGELVLPGKFGERIKSERSAQIAAVDRLVSIAFTEEEKREYEEGESEFNINEEYLQERKDDVVVLIEALARKRGLSEEEVLKDLTERAEKKKIAQEKEWAKSPINPDNRK